MTCEICNKTIDFGKRPSTVKGFYCSVECQIKGSSGQSTHVYAKCPCGTTFISPIPLYSGEIAYCQTCTIRRFL